MEINLTGPGFEIFVGVVVYATVLMAVVGLVTSLVNNDRLRDALVVAVYFAIFTVIIFAFAVMLSVIAYNLYHLV